jgi:hypothetical protein
MGEQGHQRVFFNIGPERLSPVHQLQVPGPKNIRGETSKKLHAFFGAPLLNNVRTIYSL